MFTEESIQKAQQELSAQLAAAAEAAKNEPESDEAQIRVLVLSYCNAVNTQDAEDFRQLWTRKNNTLISVSRCFEGLESVTNDFLLGGIHKAYSMIALIPESISIRLLTKKTALVIFRYHTECLRRESGEPHGIAGLETQVFSKINGQWRLEHIHYSR